MSDKTEQATPKRLAKARSEGDSPVSVALAQSVGFVAALSVLGGTASVAAQQLAALLYATLHRPRVVEFGAPALDQAASPR